ncbi:MAG: DUF4019 domain-containing protein [Pseudomonadota bacterium]
MLTVLWVALLAALSCGTLSAQENLREVNITAGSTAGWVPTEELEVEAVETLERYFRLLDAGDYDSAHAMMGSGLRALLPLQEFVRQQTVSSKEWGSKISHEITKITWTKDAPGIPQPGIYVALDMTAKFASVDRHCGYMILHKAPNADGFAIVRTESTYLDNEAAQSIAEEDSPLQLELVWRIVARSCPNYVPDALPDTLSDGVEYATVSEARLALENKFGTETKEENGWTIIADPESYSIWSFAPQGDPTYPSVVKRWVKPTGSDNSEMSMGLLCEAEKPVCDWLFEEMALVNGFIPLSLE